MGSAMTGRSRDDTIDPTFPDVFAPARTSVIEVALPADVFVETPSRQRGGPTPSTVSGTRTRRKDRHREAGRLRPGSTVDKYRIEELLGVGGFAVVYRATHMLLCVQVALKLLRTDVVARRPQLAAQLLQEARFAARIDHPNVVKILDVTHTADITYIVMELIRGTNLARFVDERGALGTPKVAQIGRDVVAGLSAGLDQGVIHRDIKPANILLSASSGAARIVDLGLANVSEPGADDTGPLRDATIVGTRGYMSPEQIRDPRSVDFRSDIFSLGVTLREAATGISPSGTRQRTQQLQTASSELDRILEWMTATDPADRPESYAALDAALSKFS
jgi:serine/threonine protein kinase